MPRAKTPLRAALDELRTTGLARVELQPWMDAFRLTPAQLRRPSTPLLSRLMRHRDVIVIRLVDLQPTLVHRDLWPDLLAVALCGADWQTEWLSPQERRLLELVDEEGVVHADEGLAGRLDAVPKRLGNGLIARLLVLGTWARREKGDPMRAFVSWWRWAEENRVAPSPDEIEAANRIQAAAGSARLPWHHRALRHRWGW